MFCETAQLGIKMITYAILFFLYKRDLGNGIHLFCKSKGKDLEIFRHIYDSMRLSKAISLNTIS